MKEVEGKILEIDVNAVVEKLEKLGAEKEYESMQVVKCLDFEDNTLYKQGNLLRLRKVGDKVELTYKGPVQKDSDFKIREEIETYIDDFDKAMEILSKIGLKEKVSYEKKRISYKCGDVHFEIDDYVHLPIPPFIEIEAGTEEQVYEWVEKLGYKKEDMKSYSLDELMEYYNIKPNELR